VRALLFSLFYLYYFHPSPAYCHKSHIPLRKNQAAYIFVATVLLTSLLCCSKVCQTGYENPNCSVQVRSQFENLYYTVTESRDQDSAYSYAATIVSDPNILRVQLTNVANGAFINNVVATATADTLTIAYQAPDTNAHYIQGSGIISGSVLLLTYTITYPDSVPVPHTQTDYYQGQWAHP
jgi:hypothetical protein